MKQMLLSDAIRLGAMLGPQIYCDFWDSRGGTCALGAAYVAVGILKTVRDQNIAAGSYEFLQLIMDAFPYLDKHVEHPHAPGYTRLSGAIVDLNDVLCLSREEIADYVEAQERRWACGRRSSLSR